MKKNLALHHLSCRVTCLVSPSQGIRNTEAILILHGHRKTPVNKEQLCGWCDVIVDGVMLFPYLSYILMSIAHQHSKNRSSSCCSVYTFVNHETLIQLWMLADHIDVLYSYELQMLAGIVVYLVNGINNIFSWITKCCKDLATQYAICFVCEFLFSI